MTATTDDSATQERDVIPIRRAIVSVSDKSGLLELAAALDAAGVEIVSTGSTARMIADAGHAVTEVSEVTGFPESLDGRVKTLHPAVHAGILADLRRDEHARELAALKFSAFELVVVNLYPFVETVASGAASDAVIEQIDIGGPAMVRSAAKNHANVAIAVSPANYPQLIKALTLGGTTLAQRQRLAGEAFAHTAAYDTAVAAYFASHIGIRAQHPLSPVEPTFSPVESTFSPVEPVETLNLSFGTPTALRYGENSHQSATLYRSANGRGIAQATQLNGKEMSYNNFVDADAALRAAFDFDEPAVAIIKHANPCGIAVGSSIASAHRRAHECDPVSAFGGVIAANRVVDLAAAESIKDIFTEVIVSPGFTEEALATLVEKKNLRLLALPVDYVRELLEWRQVSGGVLTQQPDTHFAEFSTWTLAAGEAADEQTRADLEFAWRAVRAVKSNAILLARDGASVGVGMGQVNRVDACRLAIDRAGGRANGSVAASDAFFPFADGLQVLLDGGVMAVVQPGGSVRDAEVIAAAQDAGATLYFTGERHFFH